MTFGELKLKVFRYILLDKASASTVDATYEPLIEQAINAARKWAEQDHDFDCLRVGVIGTVPGDGSGLDWHEALPSVYDSETTYNLKRIEDAYIHLATGDLPIRHLNRKQQAQKVKDLPAPGQIPDDEELQEANLGYASIMVLHGKMAFLDPQSTEDIDVRLDGIAWASDYTSDDDEDWFLQHGHNFLFWQSVVELNHLTKIFVYRQEGNVMPPDKMAMTAYQTLKLLDDYIHEGNTNFDRE